MVYRDSHYHRVVSIPLASDAPGRARVGSCVCGFAIWFLPVGDWSDTCHGCGRVWRVRYSSMSARHLVGSRSVHRFI